jgi:hypothetical protein
MGSPLPTFDRQATSALDHGTKYQDTTKLAHGPKKQFVVLLREVDRHNRKLQSSIAGGRRWRKKKSAKAQRRHDKHPTLIATLLRRHLTDKVARTRHNTLPWRSNSCTTLLQPRHDYNRESQLPTRSPL